MRTHMKRAIVSLLSVTLFASLVMPGVLADEGNDSNGTETVTTAQTDEERTTKDNIVTTKHEVTIKGKTISYTATAGTMVVDLDGEQAEMFFCAYTADDEADASERPVTFAFNGGPGSSSSYINIGCLGPRRAELDEEGRPVSLPARLTDNDNSILDMSDLVFIDPVGTGYSRPINGSKLESFIGYENDLRSLGEFIRLYVNRYDRWGSEKYLAGESYGTTRAVGLCDYLRNNYALDMNGLILISATNDDLPSTAEWTDLPHVTMLPTFAADAWYHKKVAKKYQDMELEEFLEEVKAFASKDYNFGLFMGDRLSTKEKEDLAAKLADYIGLPKDYLLQNNLRVSQYEFAKELLKDEKLSVGRYDGRVCGQVTTSEEGITDPSESEIDLAFGNTFVDYVTRELKFKTDVPYVPASIDVFDRWTYPDNKDYISQEETILGCMSRNKFLRIWVLCGYYDAATPFFATEWTYSHVFLNEDMLDNLQFTYYPSGHMIYLDKDSFDKFRKDAEAWFGKGQASAPEDTETSKREDATDEDEASTSESGKTTESAKTSERADAADEAEASESDEAPETSE